MAESSHGKSASETSPLSVRAGRRGYRLFSHAVSPSVVAGFKELWEPASTAGTPFLCIWTLRTGTDLGPLISSLEAFLDHRLMESQYKHFALTAPLFCWHEVEPCFALQIRIGDQA